MIICSCLIYSECLINTIFVRDRDIFYHFDQLNPEIIARIINVHIVLGKRNIYSHYNYTIDTHSFRLFWNLHLCLDTIHSCAANSTGSTLFRSESGGMLFKYRKRLTYRSVKGILQSDAFHVVDVIWHSVHNAHRDWVQVES